jgi:hypothetical protein
MGTGRKIAVSTGPEMGTPMNSWFLRGRPEDLPPLDLWEGAGGFSLTDFGEMIGDGYGNGEAEEGSGASGNGWGDGDL